jgi:transketolase
LSLLSIKLAKKIRESSLRMVSAARASHIGSALSIADVLAVLYGGVMRYDPSNDQYEERDRFILSKGHACVALYSALAHSGFFELDELDSYGKDFSWLMNHASHKVHGVEFSTGSLGHGLPFSVGKALAAKSQGSNWHVYVLLSDGEMDEGSNWEALMFASHHELSNLTAIIDYNKLQSLDTVQNTLVLEPLVQKLQSFGCFVVDVNGHDHVELSQAFSYSSKGRPKVIVANTTKGKGVSFMENKVEWHYKNPSSEELICALKELEIQFA